MTAAKPHRRLYDPHDGRQPDQPRGAVTILLLGLLTLVGLAVMLAALTQLATR